jgi:hypothetical protein
MLLDWNDSDFFNPINRIDLWLGVWRMRQGLPIALSKALLNGKSSIAKSDLWTSTSSFVTSIKFYE